MHGTFMRTVSGGGSNDSTDDLSKLQKTSESLNSPFSDSNSLQYHVCVKDAVGIISDGVKKTQSVSKL